ncbi:uncharacterized protein LOC142771734 isoform X2 [Rhipicephalus microplus]|uniref:uncharacterized protein LOC142771734 isoform X2 n=1 Tax=Rhipicephalus microplus TaxID=6941 RepID=UPI003F6CCC8B
MADKPDTKSPSRSGRSPSPAEAAGSEAALKRGAGSPRRKATSSSPSKNRGSPARKSRSSSPSPARSVTGSPSRRRRKTSPPSSPRSKSPKSSSPRLSSRSPRATVSGSKGASPTGKLGKRFKSRISAAIHRDRERRSRIYQWFKGLAGRKGSPRGGSSPRLRHSGRSRASPGFMSPSKSGSVRRSHTGSPSRSAREHAPPRSKYGSSTLLALVVVAFVVAVIILATGRYLRNHAASTLHQCVGETCHRYEELLSNAMDPEAQPCDNFYAHVCGTWIKTARKPVYEVNWERFLVEIAKRTADLNPLVGANQRPVDKAVTYIKACLSPLERDNMPEVRAALAAARVVWPQDASKTDFLYSMFYMSCRVFQPVFLTIDVTIMEGPRTLLLSIGNQAPLSDSINVSAYMQAQVSKSGQPSQTLYAGYQALDATVFSGFRINPQLLAFPWYEPDAHVGVLLGGLGARLAAVTFYDYVERTGTNSTLYSENQDCLSPASNVSVGADVDADLQGAVAAAAVVADVYKEVARKKDPKWTGREAPPPWTSERMPFVFFCWLNCGDSERGPMMCNAPMMHNWDFARVFACPEEAPMNPSIKCRMRL